MVNWLRLAIALRRFRQKNFPPLRAKRGLSEVEARSSVLSDLAITLSRRFENGFERGNQLDAKLLLEKFFFIVQTP